MERFSSAALNLKGCSELPTRIYIEIDDAAALWALDRIVLHDSPSWCTLQASGSLLTSTAHRQRAGPPSSQTLCFTALLSTVFQITLPRLI